MSQMTLEPKPCLEGGVIGFVQCSRQDREKISLPESERSCPQAMLTLPPLLESAPYFPALVASSWTAIPRACAVWGDKNTGRLSMCSSRVSPGWQQAPGFARQSVQGNRGFRSRRFAARSPTQETASSSSDD